jgi:protoporphyrinogen/coproporphyrinogen III oxidase
MKRIAIIGGGISGLAAAFRLEKQRSKGLEIDYVLFESSERFGGVIRTERINHSIVEAGPDSFLTEKPWAADLCRDLGLGDNLIGSNDAGRTTYILVQGRLVPLPDGLMFMVPTKLLAAFLSPLFSWKTKLRMLGEWFYRPSRDDSDVSVAEFVERHYGREMVERVADPLVAGVYGGSADKLSMRSVLARFASIETEQGSLGRAMVKSRKLRGNGPGQPLFTSLRNGMQQMTDAILAGISPAALRPSTTVESVQPESGKWLVIADGRTEEFDAVIISTPAHAAAELLSEANVELATELAAIRYSSSVTLALGYDEKVCSALPPGFGFLVPGPEKRRLIAATFVHNKFPHRAPGKFALIRCFLGGTRDEAALNSSDAEIEEIVRRELGQILGIHSQPTFVRIYRWKNAMAQYAVGHGARLERIRAFISVMPGLALAGNAYSGIGVPDCIRSGSEAAGKVLNDLGISQLAQAG